MSKFQPGDVVYRIKHSETIYERNNKWYNTYIIKIARVETVKDFVYSFYGTDTWCYYSQDFIKLNERQLKCWRLIHD